MQAIKATSALMFILFLGGAGLTPAQNADTLYARIKADRVNLRAKPDATGEVVAQATLDERLRVQEAQAEWVSVWPPDRVDLWVHRDFVKDGLSVGEKINVRAGAGINFSVVGQYQRGERVEVRGQFGEWLKVGPSNAVLWVNRELVDLMYPAQAMEPAPAPVVAAPVPAAPMPAITEAVDVDSGLGPVIPGSEVARTTPPPLVAAPVLAPGAEAPRDLKLVPLEGQGRLVQQEGELKPAPFIFGRPSKYRMTRREGNQLKTICYVRGNSKQLSSLLNERLIVHGREYWVQGVRQPVLVLERIERPVR